MTEQEKYQEKIKVLDKQIASARGNDSLLKLLHEIRRDVQTQHELRQAEQREIERWSERRAA